jgi:hypothetical protein
VGPAPGFAALNGYTGACLYDTADQRTGTRNNFEVLNVRVVNGVRVVFGRKVHTVQVAPDASALIAYFATNMQATSTSQVGVISGAQGVLLPQCNLRNASTPCSVNTRDTNSPAIFGLFKDALTGEAVHPGVSPAIKYSSVRDSIYWRKSFSAWANRDTVRSSLSRQSPSLETLVQVCAETGSPSWSCRNGTDRLTNYFSPVSAFPAFAEFAVTPQTQQGRNDPNKTSGYNWFFNGTGFFKAPHPPFYIKAYDYDGHMISQYDPNSAVLPSSSNRRAECFEGRMDGKFTTPMGTWPSLGTWANPDSSLITEQKCKMFFGEKNVDPAGVEAGNLFKLDFDFGSSNFSGPTSNSDVYGNVWTRCADGSACSATRSCPDQSACSGSRMFSQHILNTIDFPFIDVDNIAREYSFTSRLPQWFSTAANPKSAVSQIIFSAYGCYSGSRNQPPKFVNSLDTVAPFNAGDCGHVLASESDFIIETEITCKVNETCTFPIYARDFTMDDKGKSVYDGKSCFHLGADFNGGCESHVADETEIIDARYQSCDVVQIYMTPGWEDPKPSLVHAHCSKDKNKMCVRDSDCAPSLGTCTGSDNPPRTVCESSVDEMGAAKCFYKEDFTFADAGKYVVRCFSARDPQGDLRPSVRESDVRLNVTDGVCGSDKKDKACSLQPLPPGFPGVDTNEKRTCSSPPLCFRIKVESNAPYWVAPTPLEQNSRDDNGQLVPGRTDIGSCEGYPLQLTLSAKDDDEGDMVRIFLEDKDIDPTIVLTDPSKKQLIDMSIAKTYNLDFFDNATLPMEDIPLQCAGTERYDEALRSTKEQWFGFNPYDAKKVGESALQPTILPLAGDLEAKSIMSDYHPSIQYAKEPELSVQFTLDPKLRNGIAVRNSDSESQYVRGENCRRDDAMTVDDNRCRQKLVNMDQIVCAYAYDNARMVRRRWVGPRNPNTNTQKNDRTHSNGDMASPMHCWRIRMQAPPVFVTDPLLQATPFSPTWQVSEEDGSPVTGNTRAYTVLQAQIGQTVTKTFIAWDPNPDDSIEIFIVGDPAPPSGLIAGRSTCISQQGMCGTKDISATKLDNLGLEKQKSSSCSKAKLTVSWTPGPEHQGMTARVCAVARDSSTLCYGKGPKDATSSGWYGEQMCVIFQVDRPHIVWAESSDVLATGTSMQFGYVGCQVNISAVAKDVAEVYDVDVDVAGDLPNGAVVRSVKEKGLAKKILTWIPKRGSEGSTVTVCFSAQDSARALPPLPKACRTITVQKCQYCVRGSDTLGSIMKGYGLDTNWLRIWLHNGNANPAGSGLPVMVDNPDLIVPKNLQDLSEDELRSNSQGLPIIYVGPVYAVQSGESLPLLARKFRTTISSILSVNPDIRGEHDVVPGVEMCLIPCAGQELKA